MMQEEILEYNKRCAEFLGMYDYSKNNEYFEKGNCYCYPEKEKNPGSGYYTIIQNISDGYCGIFNSDWNWIMDIVTAIREKGWRFDIQHHSSVTSSEIGVTIWRKFPGGGDEEVVELYHEDDKTVHIQSINQFLIWYKENNK